MRSSLRTRLLIAVSVVALTAVIAVAVTARQSTRLEFRRFQELARTRAPERVGPATAKVAALLSGRCCAADALRSAAALVGPGDAVAIFDGMNRVVALTGPGLDNLTDVRLRVDGDRLSLDAMRHQDGYVESLALQFRSPPSEPMMLADGRAGSVSVLSLPPLEKDLPETRFLGSVDRRLLILTSAIGVLALAATWMLTRRIAGPITELGDAARDLANGNLSRRVPTRGTDEVAQLARGFNAMAAGLERQQSLRRNLVHDVAHELRTPLTALRCRLETLIDGLTPDPREALLGANEEVRHLSQLVDDLQELAQAEARELRFTPEELNVASLVDSAAHAAGLEGDRRFAREVPQNLTVRADPVRLRQVLLNLLDNAARHAPAGASVVVRAAARDGRLHVEVHNTGSSLDDEQLAMVFDRFYRADPARQRSTGGSGLGLAIVKHLIEAQGGDVSARREAAGVTFGFTVPLTPREVEE